METIVEKIHREFDESQDKLLLKCPNASAEALHNMGFYRSKSAQDYDPYFQTIKETAQYFRNTYPQYKFISERQVQTICTKYNLVLAQVQFYTGSVPHSKVAEIMAFKVARRDLRWRSINEYSEIQKHPIHQYYHGPNGPISNENEMCSGYDLWICAPESDIESSGLTKVGNNLVEHVRVDDPVVLQPVEQGFLIVAAWGPEASDELIVNEKMN